MLCVLSCQQQNGCDAPALAYPEPPPPGGAIQSDVLRMRVTQRALDFLREHVGVLLQRALKIEGSQASYLIDEAALGDPDTIAVRDGCIGEPDEPCGGTLSFESRVWVNLDQLEDQLVFEWLPEDVNGEPGFHFGLRQFDVFADIALALRFTLPGGDLTTATCHIRDTGNQAAIRIDELSFDVRMFIDDTTSPPRFDARLQAPFFHIAAATTESRLTVTACDGVADIHCDDPFCVGDTTSCNQVCTVANLFLQLDDFIWAIVNPLMETLGPVLSEQVSGVMIDALQQIPLGVIYEVPLGSMLGPTFTHTEPWTIGVKASTDLGVEGENEGRGLDLGLDGGIATGESLCAQGRAAPNFAALAGPPPAYGGFVQVPTADGDTRPEPYHAVLSISQALMNQVAWSVFRSGIACFSLDTFSLADQIGDLFVLGAGILATVDVNLQDLVALDAPMLIAVRAYDPPQVTLGAARTRSDGTYDPLLTLETTDLEIDIYVFIDDGYRLLSRVAIDTVLSLDAYRTPAQKLELAIREVSFKNFRQTYNELAPEADLSDLLALFLEVFVDTFLDSAVSFLGGEEMSFSFDFATPLSEAIGMPLHGRIHTIRRDLGNTGVPYLSAYLSMCDDVAVADPQKPWCYAQGPAQAHQTPSMELILETLARDAVEVATSVPGPFTYRYRVDQGSWRIGETTRDNFWVQSHRLLVPGEHAVEVELWQGNERHRQSFTLRVDAKPALAQPVEVAPSESLPPQELQGCQAVPAPGGLFLLMGAFWLKRRRMILQ